MSHKVKQIFVSDTKKRLFFGSLTLFLIFSLIGFSGFSAIYLFYKNANIKNKLKEVKSKELKQNNNTTVFYDTDISNAYNGLAQNIYNINRIVFNIFSYKSIAKDIKINNVSDLISISDKHLSARELIKTNRDYLKEYSLIKENMLVKILSLPGANTYLVNLAKGQGLNGYYLEINNPEINTNKKIESLINDLKLKEIETVLLTSKPANFDTEFIKKFDLLSIDFRTSDIDNLKSLYSTRLLADIFELRDSSKFLNEIELVLPSLSIDYTIHNNKSVRKEIIDNERYYKIVRSEAYKYNFNKETNSAILSYINTKDKSKHSVFLADDVSLYSFLKDNREKLGSISNLSIPNLGGEISDIWPIVLSFNKDKSFKLNSDFEISYVNEVAGKGVFYKLITLDKLGKRNISFTENGDIKKYLYHLILKKLSLKKLAMKKVDYP